MKFIKTFSIIIALILALGCVTVGADGYSVPEPLLYGDVDMDGEVTIKDATAIQKGIAELEYLTSVQRFIADPNKTGVSIKNATDIQKYLAELVESSSIDEVIEMRYTDKFSGKNQHMNLFIDVIKVVVKNPEWEYTLADFPEFDFSDIEVYHPSEDVKECFLYLSNPGRENVEEAIRALDYRANLDLIDVCKVELDLCID